ncbi:hypothetical protein MuYL_0795 [Mucilaginibacter xinganensis]|uniref:Uncharacterized protein n=1 Tax=Mucilaginibacter xinganensis TaxID=1234841 RepID=A0A223NS27_9SPHI|nr:hypothetical protein MuYL_0795 [Mucilaginibacter xinganensis]
MIFATCFCLNASAQSSVDCTKLLKKEIDPDSARNMENDVADHADCFGLDSIGIKIFADRTTLRALLVKNASASTGKLTYANLLSDINKAKKDTGYYNPLRNLVIAQTTLEATKISVASWDSSVKLLKVIGMPDSEMENFHQFLLEKKDKNWNYRQLVTAYRMKQMDAPKTKN